MLLVIHQGCVPCLIVARGTRRQTPGQQLWCAATQAPADRILPARLGQACGVSVPEGLVFRCFNTPLPCYVLHTYIQVSIYGAMMSQGAEDLPAVGFYKHSTKYGTCTHMFHHLLRLWRDGSQACHRAHFDPRHMPA